MLGLTIRVEGRRQRCYTNRDKKGCKEECSSGVKFYGGFLPDIVLLTQCYYHRGTRLNAMKRFCIFSYRSHLNVLTFFPPDWGMLRRSRCIQIFLQTYQVSVKFGVKHRIQSGDSIVYSNHFTYLRPQKDSIRKGCLRLINSVLHHSTPIILTVYHSFPTPLIMKYSFS